MSVYITLSKEGKKKAFFMVLQSGTEATYTYCMFVQMWRGSRTWTMKEAPVVSGGTAQQLVLWLTYHRAIGKTSSSTNDPLS